jgi:uncharacterized membrane protein YcaP (DUF421 family)
MTTGDPSASESVLHAPPSARDAGEPLNFGDLFGLSMNPLELVLRGSAVYAFLFLVFRYVLRRDVGSIGIADLLVLVLIADAAQNAMAGGYTTISDGFVLVATLVGWNYALDWASFHYESVRRWAEPPPLPLVDRGRVLFRNLRREYITPEELEAKLREQGVERLEEVKRATMESDGVVTVIRYDGRHREHADRKQPI